MPFTNNPAYTSQWHFNLIGDIETVWSDYSGTGIVVAVYDDGVEQFHSDLDGNYDPTLELFYDDGDPNTIGDAHGTAVAGIIAAENNREGGIGVAWGATLTSVDYLGDVQYGPYWLQALFDMQNFDVVNNSWGFLGFDSSRDISNNNAFRAEAEALAYAAEFGRGGLGTIIVKAAGNSGTSAVPSAQNDTINLIHETITVAATDSNGNAMNYSNWGVNLLISAPAASVTTDRAGPAGYSSGDSTSSFGGTSAATPVVSGVVALILEANGNLGWRDVQQILAMSASHSGSDFGAVPNGFEDGSWFSNGAENWNGGGLTYSINYGYGRIDALAAVRLAEVWGFLFDAPQTTDNMDTLIVSSTTVVNAINDFATTSHTLEVSDDFDIEHLYVEVNLTHTYTGELTIILVAPDGTEFVLNQANGGGADLFGYTFAVSAALGMNALGIWTLRVTDDSGGDQGQLNGFNLQFHGKGARDIDDVHTFTDDFADYSAVESDRQFVADTDGGIDWLNFAAVTADVFVDLNTLDLVMFDGVQFANVVNSDDFENVATGDGDDGVDGTNGHNEFILGRGNDAAYGYGGFDTMMGGDGDDTLDGGAGADVLYGEGGADELHGGTGADTLFGNLQNDTLDGGEDNDWLYGQAGADSLVGGDGDDRLFGGAWNDRLEGGNDNDVLYGQGGSDLINGEAGDDQVFGGAGNDTLRGASGNDTLGGGDGADKLFGQAGADSLDGGGGQDRLFGGAGNDTVDGGDLDDGVFGQSGSDLLEGGGGDDELVGGFGNDTLDGGAGDDVLTGGAHLDTFIFNGGADSISDFTFTDGDRIEIDDAAITAASGMDGATIVSTFGSVVGGQVVLDFGAEGSLSIESLASLDGLGDDLFVI